MEAVKKQACCVRPAKRAGAGGEGDSGLEPKLVALPGRFKSFFLSGFERSECAEVLFEPSREGLPVGGLAQAIHDCVQRCPIDGRRALFSSICLTGGCCAIEGLQACLQAELSTLILPGIAVRVKTPAPLRVNEPLSSERRGAMFATAAYLGAHVMTSILDADCTAEGFVDLADYEEDPQAAQRALIGQRA